MIIVVVVVVVAVAVVVVVVVVVVVIVVVVVAIAMSIVTIHGNLWALTIMCDGGPKDFYTQQQMRHHQIIMIR